MRMVQVYGFKRVPITPKPVLVERGLAKFHQFGVDYEEFAEGPGNFTTAVIEWPDGKVEMVRADQITFVEFT